MTVEFVDGQRGSILLIFENNLYTKRRQLAEGSFYRCRIRTCPGSIFLDTLNEVEVLTIHNHPNVAVEIERLKIIRRIKSRATATEERSNIIISRELQNINANEVLTELPALKSLNRIIGRERTRENNLSEWSYEDIPECLKFDSHGNPFLVFDSGFNDINRIVVFSNFKKQSFISKASIIMIDGTFRSCPYSFYQVLIIYAEFFSKYYPIYYILLKNKQELSYSKAFEYVKNQLLNVKTIIIDFEIAIKNAIFSQFLNVKCHGCYFHFAQAIWRKIQNLGYTNAYRTEALFRKGIKFFLLLAFVPLSDIYELFLKVQTWCVLNISYDMVAFIDYFQTNYLGFYNDEHQILADSRYGLSFWNTYERVLSEEPRTINAAESKHRVYNLRMHIPHPNIAVWIHEILREEEIDIFNLIRAQSGKILLSGNLKKEKLIYTIVKSYYLFEKFDYLKALSKVFKFNFEHTGNDWNNENEGSATNNVEDDN